MATNTEKIVVQVVVKGDKDLNNLNNTTKKATRGVGSLVKQYGLLTAGILGSAAAFRTINKLIADSVRAFRDYEFQMAKVKAITGANNTEFRQLSESAQELGRTTFFTAQQVAELQTNFGKLGFTTKEIMDAQEATLQLATATDSDLGRAAIVAGASVRGFGLDASETQRVVDVMAVAFTSSALDIEKFQTSMTKVAPIAKAAGFSIEDTTAIMAQLADSGIEASIAGTSLRNILLKMQDPNSDLVKSFGKTIHSLDELVPALTKFSEEGGSLAEIMEVVDLRQAAAFEQMITSRQRTIELRDALEGATGAASQMAFIVGDTLEGAFKRSQSATQGLQIVLVEKFGEGLKNIVDMFANLKNAITDFFDTPLSEQLREDSAEMNILFNTLKKQNLEQDTRNRLIAELNMKYGEYLPNIITEKTTLEQLETAQDNANQALLDRINILAMSELLQEQTQKNIETRIALAEAEKNVTNLQAENLETVRVKTEELTNAYVKDKLTRIENTQSIEGSNSALDIAEKKVTRLKKELEKGEEEIKKITDAADEMGITLEDLNKKTEQNTKNTNKSTAATKELTRTQILQTQFMEMEIQLMNAIRDKRKDVDLFEEQSTNKRIELLEETIRLVELEADEKIKIYDMLAKLRFKQYTDEQKLEEQRSMSVIAMTQSTADAIFQIQENVRNQQVERDKKRLQEQLESGIINQDKFDKEVRKIEKDKFLADQRRSIAQALINGALAVTQVLAQTGVAAGIAIPPIIAATAGQVAVIASQKFADGGMVHGKSHANGGEKFAVGGRVVELEGGEAVINKRSTSMFRSQLSAINAAGGGVKFADGGLLNMPSFATNQFNAVGMNGLAGAVSQGGRVYVLESDITNTQNNVSLIQSQAGF